MPAVFSAMAPRSLGPTARSVSMPVASSEGPSPPTYRFSCRPRSRWWSISESHAHLGSPYRPSCLPAPTGWSNDAAARVHHAARRRGFNMTARSARAAVDDESELHRKRSPGALDGRTRLDRIMPAFQIGILGKTDVLHAVKVHVRVHRQVGDG